MKSKHLILVIAVLNCINIGVTNAEDSAPNKDRPKYKYGYVVSHNEGSVQGHLETRDGNMALGRYYVAHPNGSGQKVTYLADDLGYHTGVTYSSRVGKGSTKTQISMGHKGLATLDNLEVPRHTTPFTASPFGNKIPKGFINPVTVEPSTAHSNNQTTAQDVYLIRKPTETTTGNNGSPGKPSQKENYSSAFPVTVNPNVKGKIYQFPTEAPLIKNYIAVEGNTAEVGDYQGLSSSYRKDKSLEKTDFSESDFKLISAVQKHAENIIMKDLNYNQAVRILDNFSNIPSSSSHVTAVTMQPIVVTASGTVGIQNPVSSTLPPEVKKTTKDFQGGSVNALKVSEKNGDQIAKNSGVFEVSLSPSFAPFVNVSKAPQQLIDAKSANRISSSSNFTVCGTNLCEQGNSKRAFSDSLASKPRENVQLDSDLSNTHKHTRTFYPKNQQMGEMHFVTTIDVQKGISLEVKQNEDGSIQLASSFPFNKIPSRQRPYVHHPKPEPSLSNSISLNQGSYLPHQESNFLSTPGKSYFPNVVTEVPLYAPVQSSHSPILESNVLNSQNSHQVVNQDIDYVPKLTQPDSLAVIPTGPAQYQLDSGIQGDVKLNNVGGDNQQILYAIDSQKNDDNKQKFIEEERKQYFENLQKVEELKKQNTLSKANVDLQTNIILEETPVSPAVSVESNSVETVTAASQENYTPQIQLLTKDESSDDRPYVSQLPLTYAEAVKPLPEDEIVYTKPVHYVSQNYASQETGDRNNYFESTKLQNVYIDSAMQHSSDAQVVSVPQYVQIPRVEPRFKIPEPVKTEEKVEKVQPALPAVAVPQSHLTTLPLQVTTNLLTQDKTQALPKPILFNPFAYASAFQFKQPVSFLPTFPVQLQSGSEPAVSTIYQIPPTQFEMPVSAISLPQISDLNLPFPQISPQVSQQFRLTIPQRSMNKLRIQPLKPSPPAEEAQSEMVRNVLSQPQFNPTYYYPGFPQESHLQLRHIGKQKFGNFPQAVPSEQSLTRIGKNLKDLRIEYGFKPPLRPSVEFSGEVKPSIYGPSVPQK